MAFFEWFSWKSVLWFIVILALMFVLPRLWLYQLLRKLELTVAEFEQIAEKTKQKVLKKISKRPSKSLKEGIDRACDFFIILPASLDPVGVVKKIDYALKNMRDRFSYYTEQLLPKSLLPEKENLTAAIITIASICQIAKEIKHIVGSVKKYKNFQLILLLQMRLPMIKKIVNAQVKATEAFLNNWPVGDSIGPLVIANMIGYSKVQRLGKDIVFANRKIKGKDCILIKPRGPSALTGGEKLVKAIEKTVKQYKIKHLIMIDAVAKKEGEKTGSVSEGAGIMIGGAIPVYRQEIEDFIIKKKIAFDGIAIKIGLEEAFMPMKQEIYNSVSNVVEAVYRNLKRVKGNVLIVGVGNSSGIGNNLREVKEVGKLIKKIEKKRIIKRD